MKFFKCVLLIMLLIAPSSHYASAFVRFGGLIVGYKPVCVKPMGVLIYISHPTPMSLMYTPETIPISYSYGPPAHPGQWLLGMAGLPVACLVPCQNGLCPIGAGLNIVYHGSSL